MCVRVCAVPVCVSMDVYVCLYMSVMAHLEVVKVCLSQVVVSITAHLAENMCLCVCVLACMYIACVCLCACLYVKCLCVSACQCVFLWMSMFVCSSQVTVFITARLAEDVCVRVCMCSACVCLWMSMFVCSSQVAVSITAHQAEGQVCSSLSHAWQRMCVCVCVYVQCLCVSVRGCVWLCVSVDVMLLYISVCMYICLCACV